MGYKGESGRALKVHPLPAPYTNTLGGPKYENYIVRLETFKT